MIPSFMSVVAACILVWSQRGKATLTADSGNHHYVQATNSATEAMPHTQSSIMSRCIGPSLIVWAAVSVGLLHALQSITSGFMVSFGFSLTDAGDTVARSQAVALGVLFLLAALAIFLAEKL